MDLISSRFPVLVCSLVLLAACSGQSLNPSSNDPRVAEIYGTPIFDDSGAVAKYLSDTEAFYDELSTCMRAEGFEYVAQEYDPATVWPEEYLRDIEAGMTEEAYAEKYGYGVAPVLALPTAAIPTPDPDDPAFDPAADEAAMADLEAMIDELPDEESPEGRAYWDALDGEGGCTDQASEKWLKGHVTLLDSTEDLEERFERFQADARVVDFYEGWAICMAGRGFGQYGGSPLEFKGAFERAIEEDYEGFMANSAAIVKEEIDAAMATVECGGTVVDLLPDDLLTVWSEYSNPEWTQS